MANWLLKTEPDAYSWQDLLREGRTEWDGVRNYAARNNLAAMKTGDVCVLYHSQGPRECVGLARVVKEAYPDPSALDDPRGWVCVDIEPQEPLPRAVSLDELKAHKTLSQLPMVRMGRLSVSPVTGAQMRSLLALAKRPAPQATEKRRATSKKQASSKKRAATKKATKKRAATRKKATTKKRSAKK